MNKNKSRSSATEVRSPAIGNRNNAASVTTSGSAAVSVQQDICSSSTAAVALSPPSGANNNPITTASLSTITSSQGGFVLPLDRSTRTPLLIQRMVGVGQSPATEYDRLPSNSLLQSTGGQSTVANSNQPVAFSNPLQRSAKTTTTPALPLDAGRWFPTASFNTSVSKSTSASAIGGHSYLWQFQPLIRPPTGSTIAAAPITTGGGCRPGRFPRMGQSCLNVGTDCGGRRGTQRAGGTTTVSGRTGLDAAGVREAGAGLTSARRGLPPEVPSSCSRQKVASPGSPYYCVGGGQLAKSSLGQFHV